MTSQDRKSRTYNHTYCGIRTHSVRMVQD